MEIEQLERGRVLNVKESNLFIDENDIVFINIEGINFPIGTSEEFMSLPEDVQDDIVATYLNFKEIMQCE